MYASVIYRACRLRWFVNRQLCPGTACRASPCTHTPSQACQALCRALPWFGRQCKQSFVDENRHYRLAYFSHMQDLYQGLAFLQTSPRRPSIHQSIYHIFDGPQEPSEAWQACCTALMLSCAQPLQTWVYAVMLPWLAWPHSNQSMTDGSQSMSDGSHTPMTTKTFRGSGHGRRAALLKATIQVSQSPQLVPARVHVAVASNVTKCSSGSAQVSPLGCCLWRFCS